MLMPEQVIDGEFKEMRKGTIVNISLLRGIKLRIEDKKGYLKTFIPKRPVFGATEHKFIDCRYRGRSKRDKANHIFEVVLGYRILDLHIPLNRLGEFWYN